MRNNEIILRKGIELKTCAHCGQKFIGLTSAAYCSDKCKVNDWRTHRKPVKQGKLTKQV